MSSLEEVEAMKAQVNGYLTFAKEPIEYLHILEQFRRHGEVDDQVFELAVAKLLQEGGAFLVPDTVKLFAGQKEQKVC